MFFSQNHGKSALMIMVIVKSVIFFGKSEKNIWVLDFFNYNHKYETVKQSKQMEQYHSRNRWNSITVKTVKTVKTVITAITAITPTT